MRLFTVIFLVFWWVSTSRDTSAQPYDEYQYLKHSSISDTIDKLSLRLYEHNFFKNNEYFGNFIKGYTLAGFHFQPEITYNINSQVQVQAMLNVLKYHGYDKYSECNPYMRIVFRPNSSLTVIGGYLEGNVRHNMLEPIYNPERYYLGTFSDRYYTRNVENGIQLLLNRSRYHGDLWLNWENFILWGDNDQERLSVGHVSKLDIVDNPAGSLSLVAEFLAAHRGGQIDSSASQMQSLENGAIGLEYNKIENGSQTFRQFSFSAMMVQYHAMSATDDLPWKDGWAAYLKGHLRLWNLGLTAGYWQAHRFVSFRGDPLFSCWAIHDEDNRQNRKMLFGELYFCKDYYDGVFTLKTGGNAYFDLNVRELEYVYMLSMIVRPRIRLIAKNSLKH